MNLDQIAQQRINSQGLTNSSKCPLEILDNLGCLQAQDYRAACWGIGQRSNASFEQISSLYNQGKITRTHVLRPTWHFVLPENLVWIQNLTSHRVKAACASTYKNLGLDQNILKESNSLLQSILINNHLSKKQIKEHFVKNGFKLDDERKLYYFILNVQLDNVICSGKMQGKEHTFALLKERINKPIILNREDSLKRLTEIFFTSHGPATLKDFVWWSGLFTVDAKLGIEANNLKSTTIDDKTYFYFNNNLESLGQTLLLPRFDEYVVAYKDKEVFTNKSTPLSATSSSQPNGVVQNGKLVGKWTWNVQPKKCIIKIETYNQFAEKKSLEDQISKLSNFVGLPVELHMV